MHQFEISPLIPLQLGGVDISFTNASLWMVIAVTVSTFFFTAALNRATIIPGRFQAMAEGAYDFVAGLISDNLGSHGKEYFPLVFSLFIFVYVCNTLGMIPYSFTVTSHLIVTAALALLIFFTVLVIGVARHGFHFLGIFVPSGVPGWLLPLVVLIEFISFLSRPVTLSVRLFANMVAGHVMLKVIAGFSVMFISMGGLSWAATALPVAMNVLMIGFEFFIAYIQAYVFAVLACIYLKDTIEVGH
jgi:F-type H+-transporting ATPase subunit a